ncbi:MAG: ABC transporter permease subunit [Rhodospirillaceae bacterium]|nr:ABC transporter permease subunit [Rhodospirillaceae bacterium]
MSTATIRPPRVAAIRIITLLTVALVWEALGRSGLIYNDVVPPLTAIAAAAIEIVSTARFYLHLGVTALEVAAGFAIAVAAGVALGLLFGIRRYLGAAADPYVAAIATTPKIVFLPIIMLTVGIGIGSKVAIGALSAVFPIIIGTAGGVRAVKPVLIRVGRAFNLSRGQMVRMIYLPALAVPIVTGMRLGLGVCIVGVLLGEIKLANAGLGFLANEYYTQFRIASLYAVIAIVFALAALANAAMSRLARRSEAHR